VLISKRVLKSLRKQSQVCKKRFELELKFIVHLESK
jgi:hypothetical protein